MSIVGPNSKVYAINFGEYKGRTCVLFNYSIVDGMIKIIFADVKVNELATVKVGALSQLETPGWPLEEEFHKSHGLKECLQRSGDGSNMLRISDIAQPRALKLDDVLASGEKVVKPLRSGYNSSCLACLDRTGWVEIAPRFPIALLGNKSYKFPEELRAGDRLATGCVVVKDPISNIDWVRVYLNVKWCKIEIPSCIPLALAVASDSI
jgi:hypothetical protein